MTWDAIFATIETKASSGWREARVEDGDAEAPRVEERRELEHRVEVAMERQGEEDDAAAVAAVAVLLSSGHGRRQSGCWGDHRLVIRNLVMVSWSPLRPCAYD